MNVSELCDIITKNTFSIIIYYGNDKTDKHICCNRKAGTFTHMIVRIKKNSMKRCIYRVENNVPKEINRAELEEIISANEKCIIVHQIRLSVDPIRARKTYYYDKGVVVQLKVKEAEALLPCHDDSIIDIFHTNEIYQYFELM